MRPTPTLPALRVALAVLATGACAVGACADGGAPAEPSRQSPVKTPSVAVAAAPGAVTVQSGQSGTATVTVSRAGGYTGEVTLVAEGLPAGVTATFAPAALSGDAVSSTLTLLAGEQAAVGGPVPVTVRASGAGVTDAVVALPLTVAAAPALGLTAATGTLALTPGTPATTTLTLARPAGIAGAVALSVVAPAGVTAAATPNPLSADASAATLTVAATAGAAAGEIVVTATGAGAQAARVAIPYTVAAAPSYTLAVAPSTVAVTAGSAAAAATVTLARTNFAGAVTLAATGAPAGLTVALPAAAVAGGEAVVSVQAASTVAAGDYPITITGSAAGVAPASAAFVARVAAANMPGPGVVTGVARDARGRALADAVVDVKMVFNPNVVRVHTGADGRYTARGLPAGLSHQVKAWLPVDYRGKAYCVRLAMPNATDYDAFVPSEGVVRDFRWQLTGRIPDAGNNYFGASLSLAMASVHYDTLLEDGDDVEIRLVPDGPLVDGSEGAVVTRTVRFHRTGWESRLLDIPHGVYTASATRVRAGVRTALKVGKFGFGSQLGATTTVHWEPDHPGTCSQVLGPDLQTFSLQLGPG
jgi:hypothetical protein